MRIAVIGALAFVGLVCGTAAVAVGPSEGSAQRQTAAPTGGGGLVTLSTPAGDHLEQITIIDSDTRTMAVYHIDTGSGIIFLKSVRNIHYDLRMLEFNGTNPLPGEIRAILEQR